MTLTQHRTALLAAIFVLFSPSAVLAATVLVAELGDAAWDSGDTRVAGYLDLHGDMQVVSGRTTIEDALIADRISFTASPGNPPLGNGALSLTTYAADDKATLVLTDWSEPFGSDVTLEYAWFVASDGVPTAAAPAIKIGIDTTDSNSMSNISVDRGEDGFDKILVYEPYFNGPKIDDVWTPEIITPTDGLWWLVNLDPASGLLPGGVGDLRTLDQWAIEFTAAGLAGATMTSLQVGVGAGNPAKESYVDFLIYSNAGEGMSTTWDFDAPAIPVPSLTGLFGLILPVLLGLLSVWFLSRTRSDAV